jgi:hypothetical protein
MPEEHPPEIFESRSSNLDDIFVPGVGVRAALGDDDPEPSRFWPRMAATCTQAKTILRRSGIRTYGGICRSGSRLGVVFASARNQVKAYHPAWPTRLKQSGAVHFHQARQHADTGAWAAVLKLRNATAAGWARSKPFATSAAQRIRRAPSGLHRAHQHLGIGARVAVVKLRNSAAKGWIRSKPFAIGTAQRARILHSRLQQVLQLTRARIQADLSRSLRTSVPLARRRIQSWFERGLNIASRKLRAAGVDRLRYGVRIPDWRGLRRALPALAVLVAMVVFVIQRIALAVRR